MGGCLPPTASFSQTAGVPARVCQGEFISLNGSASTAAPGRSIEQWVWDRGSSGRDTTTIPFAIYPFSQPGVHFMTLEVIDDIGCSSGPSDPVIVFVSAEPDFGGSSSFEFACEGEVLPLLGQAIQPPMIHRPIACSPPSNGIPLLDDAGTPSVANLIVAGQPDGVIASLDELGEICLEMEHSFMGDLVLTVTCPNGQSVVLHQQGGGGTFLGDANDSDGGGSIVPGSCFQYCFSPSPDFGTWVESIAQGPTENLVPVSQGTAIAPGRYASLQPLEQLLGCPFNGSWTFTSQDLFGADNGYLCGWCISFGQVPDSSYVDDGPVLGSSSDSSFWSGNGVSNTAGQPGVAQFIASEGEHTLTYTVIDSYGCEYGTEVMVSVGAEPEVTIENDPDLGLLCAQGEGATIYQWSFQGQAVIGANGPCFTPPGPGLVSVFVENEQGCTAEDTYLNTALNDQGSLGRKLMLYPSPNDGHFALVHSGGALDRVLLNVIDARGRTVHQRISVAIPDSVPVPVECALVPGLYTLELVGPAGRIKERFMVR